jgi:hypothetical protein
MPPKPKVKSAKSDEDKKSKAKKPTAATDEPDQVESKEELSNTGISAETVVNSVIEVKEPVPIVEEVVEIKYEEPVLTYLTVERYNIFKR